MQLFLKILSGKANSVNSDQTAPQEQSDLGPHCLHVILSDKLVFEILGHLSYLSSALQRLNRLRGSAD